MTSRWKKAAALRLLSAGVLITFAGTAQHAGAQVNTSLSSYDGVSFSSESNVPLAKPRWTSDIGQALNEIGQQPSVVVDSGSLYYVKNGSLIAQQSATGKILWSFGSKLNANAVKRDGTILYVYSSDGSVYRVSAATGKGSRIYQVKGQPQQGQPLISNLMVDGASLYLTSTLGLIAVNSTTGKENWKNTSATYYQQIERVGSVILAGTFESGAITVSTAYAIDAQSGKTLWRLAGSHEGPLKIDGNKLYFQNTWPKNDGSKFVVDIDEVDLATGKITAGKSFIPVLEGIDPITQYPQKVIMDGHDVYASIPGRGLLKFNYDADPSALNPELLDDSVKWIAGPYNGKLFFKSGDNQGFYARKVVDHMRVDYTGLDNPVSRLDLIDSGLYAGQTDGDIFAYNVVTSKALFRFKTSARNYGPFQVSGNTLIAQADGKLYAFGLPAELRKPAAADNASGTYSKASAKLTINGVERKFEPGMMTTNNRMFVPLRFLTEAIGAKAAYHAQTKQTTVTYGERIFTIGEGAPYAEAAGKQTPLTYAPAMINGSLYVPIRDFGTLLGVEITWNTGSRTVAVVTKK
ncbi:stalk domain-containing protein [Paenibacillus solisilvae]|uniref:Stalk domain-containing protein n=1 Tax=Paenibacillus solisilvae TaxID=2486751 RepID=A0ABW0VVY5_9BACL